MDNSPNPFAAVLNDILANIAAMQWLPDGADPMAVGARAVEAKELAEWVGEWTESAGKTAPERLLTLMALKGEDGWAARFDELKEGEPDAWWDEKERGRSLFLRAHGDGRMWAALYLLLAFREMVVKRVEISLDDAVPAIPRSAFVYAMQ
jgi:hypothetical protein